MPLEKFSVDVVERLLALFPITHLRESWPRLNGTKEEVCQKIAAADRRGDSIAAFVDDYFSCCKQHVHVYSRDAATITQPPRFIIPGVERVVHRKGAYALYLVPSSYRVILIDSLERAELQFIWPIRVDLLFDNLAVRFVTLQKDLRSYFDRPILPNGRTVDEHTVLSNVETLPSIAGADLHKGIKHLWHADFMDASRAKYKKPKSLAWEKMDKARGIKADNPELYRLLRVSQLQDMTFEVLEGVPTSVSAVLANPSTGYLAFPRYSKKKGDTDFVIDQTLRHNQ